MLKFNTGLITSIKHNYLAPETSWTKDDMGELNADLIYMEDEYSIIGIDYNRYSYTLEGSQQLYADLYEWETPTKYILAAIIYHQLLYTPFIFLEE